MPSVEEKITMLTQNITSSPADKKYGSTLPTNKKSETSDTNIWPK